MNKRLYFLLSTVALALFLSASLNAKDKRLELSMLKEGVLVSMETPLPEKLHWIGRGQAAGGGAFGLVGAAAGGNMANKDRAKLRDLLNENAIDVGKMIAEAFAARLTEVGAVVLDAEAKAFNIEFRFKEVGLHASMNIGSSKMKPYIGVVATLTDPEGVLLWEKSALVTNLSGKTKGHPKKKIMSNPDLLRESMQEAADEIAEILIRDLKKAAD